MADYFTEFSEVLLLYGEEQKNFAEDLLLRPEDREDFPKNKAAQKKYIQRWGELLELDDPDDAADVWPCNAVSIEKTQESGVWQMWIHDEDSGHVELAVALVQAVLKHFDRYDIWTLTWAAICSKPRVGEFSGGAAVVTSDRIYYHNARDWVDQLCKDITAERVKGRKHGKPK